MRAEPKSIKATLIGRFLLIANVVCHLRVGDGKDCIRFHITAF